MKRLAAALALALAAPGLAAPAAKEAASPEVYLSEDGQTVYLIGTLREGSFLKFDAALQDAPKARWLFLASPGGLTIEGRLIAALVRKRGLDTYVEYYCASACTQVFVAGRQRVISKEAALGFHQAAVVDAKGRTKGVRLPTTRKLTATTVFGINGNDTLRLAYELAGIDPQFIDKVLQQSHSDMWEPAAPELLTAKVVTRLAERPELLLPPRAVSRAEVTARIAQLPLWRQVKQSFPSEFERAAADTWRLANSGAGLETAISLTRADLTRLINPRLLTASDDLLDRMLALHARTAREQRERDYPLCDRDRLIDNRPPDPAQAAFERNEDLLLAEALGSPAAGTPPPRDVAINLLANEVMPLIGKSYRRGDADSGAGGCRMSYRTYEAIGDLPREKRVRVFRALLAYPKLI